MTEPIRLTKTVQKGGCAAKVAASELRKILSQVKFPPTHPQLLVDGRDFDDAAIYQVAPDVAMVQTLDFFTPIVDTPYLFGRIAAANALSDVYAMGGRPVTAMAVLAFPLISIDNAVITEVLQGASDVIKEAKCTFVGGHSIDDDTLKFGLSVTGLVNPKNVWANTGAKTGDVLILTKGLGTGTLTAALKRDMFTENEIRDGLDSMAQLNNAIDFIPEALRTNVHAATDITGFGLSGHSFQMAKASDKTFVFDFDSIPKLSRALECLEKEALTKAHRTNREYTSEYVEDAVLTPIERLLIHDPQTSGGLLLSVDSSAASAILAAIKAGFPKAAIVGKVTAPTSKRLIFE